MKALYLGWATVSTFGVGCDICELANIRIPNAAAIIITNPNKKLKKLLFGIFVYLIVHGF